ncbi:unnamed protein product [Cylindrotheca closterium]|uniref:Uncharacterized protein n=1 Tax=Cylindrotheca closterium TaxID=2856 RepID=A0AAD2FSQ3_9STRA|nr:unnamed protein product [Cylindrotheca closterium]
MASNLSSEDYLQILDSIRSAYSKVNSAGDEEPTTELQQIREAFASLTDEDKRRLYDELGRDLVAIQEPTQQQRMVNESRSNSRPADGVPNGTGVSQRGASTFFSDLFGASESNGRSGPFGGIFSSLGSVLDGLGGLGSGSTSSPRASMPDRPLRQQYDIIPEGTIVSLQGLVSRPDINGDRGTVKQHDPSSGRYTVVLEDSEKNMKVKPSNLVQNSKVELVGLESIPELNGEHAEILSWDAKSERYIVFVMGRVSRAIGVKPSNVLLRNCTVVMITGLQLKPELNGKFGTIKSFNIETLRYDVQLSKEKVLRLKLENVHV